MAESCEYIEEKAKAGDAKYMYKLGQCYAPKQYEGAIICEGNNFTRDAKTAFEWIKKSADKNYLPAIKVVVCLYQEGLGTPIDEDEAFEYCKKGAKLGIPELEQYVQDCYQYRCDENISIEDVKWSDLNGLQNLLDY